MFFLGTGHHVNPLALSCFMHWLVNKMWLKIMCFTIPYFFTTVNATEFFSYSLHRQRFKIEICTHTKAVRAGRLHGGECSHLTVRRLDFHVYLDVYSMSYISILQSKPIWVYTYMLKLSCKYPWKKNKLKLLNHLNVYFTISDDLRNHFQSVNSSTPKIKTDLQPPLSTTS